MADPRLEPLVLSKGERRGSENWAKRRSTAQDLALRARIVLARVLIPGAAGASLPEQGPMACAGEACGTACSSYRIRRLALWAYQRFGAVRGLFGSASLRQSVGCATHRGRAGSRPDRDR